MDFILAHTIAFLIIGLISGTLTVLCQIMNFNRIKEFNTSGFGFGLIPVFLFGIITNLSLLLFILSFIGNLIKK